MELLQAFSTMEIWNAYFVIPDGRFTVENGDNQNYRSKLLWYSTLNEVKNGGKFIAATSGTDNHDSTGPADGETRNSFASVPNDASEYQTICRYQGKYCGSPTDYIYLPDGEITQETVLAALKAGHSFMSNGPILNCSIDSAVYGETVTAAEGKVTLTNDIFCRDGMETLRIVVNGETALEIDLQGADTYTGDITVEDLSSGDWLLIEVLGGWGVYAISNPFFIA